MANGHTPNRPGRLQNIARAPVLASAGNDDHVIAGPILPFPQQYLFG
jgi:hypothetical protein